MLNAIVTKIPHELDSRVSWPKRNPRAARKSVSVEKEKQRGGERKRNTESEKGRGRRGRPTSQLERYKRAREVHLTGHKKE